MRRRRYARHVLNNIKKYRSLQRSIGSVANQPARRRGLFALCLGQQQEPELALPTQADGTIKDDGGGGGGSMQGISYAATDVKLGKKGLFSKWRRGDGTKKEDKFAVATVAVPSSL